MIKSTTCLTNSLYFCTMEAGIVLKFFAIILIGNNASASTPGSLTKEQIEELFSANHRAKFVKNGLTGKSESVKPQKLVPRNWNSPSFYQNSNNCDQTHNVAKEGFVTFKIQSGNDECSFEFLGSRAEGCTVAILCTDKLNLGNSSKCTEAYLKISDGTFGYKELCGLYDFDNTPYKPRNSGSDLYVVMKGNSSSHCMAFCQEFSEDPNIKKAKRLPEAKLTSSYTPGKCTCGVVNNKGRIVKGEDAQKFEFPWLGGLIVKSWMEGMERVPLCGISLISDSYAVTAAHCTFSGYWPLPADMFQGIFHVHVMDKQPGLSEIAERHMASSPGWNLTTETDESEGTIRVQVEQVIRHPFFDYSTFDYDIALLKFKEKVDLDLGKVSTICLPFLNEYFHYEEDISKFIVAGWGKQDEEAAYGTRLLQKLEVPLIGMDICEKTTWPTKRHICAGYLEGGRDACNGDSGGPLIYKLNERKNQYVLAGVVSAGAGCAKYMTPGLYTDTRELVQWIYRNMAEGSTKFCPRN